MMFSEADGAFSNIDDNEDISLDQISPTIGIGSDNCGPNIEAYIQELRAEVPDPSYQTLPPMAVKNQNRLNARNVLQDEVDELNSWSPTDITLLFDTITESIDKRQTVVFQGPNILSESNDDTMELRGGGAPSKIRSIITSLPNGGNNILENSAVKRKLDLPVIVQRFEEPVDQIFHVSDPVPAKRPRFSSALDLIKSFLFHVFFLEETIKNVAIGYDCHWSFFVPSAKKFFTDDESPPIFVTASYTQRSDSALVFFVKIPDGRYVSHTYNISKNNDQAREGTIASYYECEQCERKCFKLVLDKNENVAYVKIPGANEGVLIDHSKCGIITSKDDPKSLIRKKPTKAGKKKNVSQCLNHIFYEIALGKTKALCKTGQVLDDDAANAILVDYCQRICENIKTCGFFDEWVAEEFNMFYVPWELQVNWRQEWPDAEEYNPEGFLMHKKEMREQAFRRIIKEAEELYYWSQLLYDAISDSINDEERAYKIAYEASRMLTYSLATSLSGDLDGQAEAFEKLHEIGWPLEIDWKTINSIVEIYEKDSKVNKNDVRTIKLPPGFEMSSWFSKQMTVELEAEKTIRSGLKNIGFLP